MLLSLGQLGAEAVVEFVAGSGDQVRGAVDGIVQLYQDGADLQRHGSRSLGVVVGLVGHLAHPPGIQGFDRLQVAPQGFVDQRLTFGDLDLERCDLLAPGRSAQLQLFHFELGVAELTAGIGLDLRQGVVVTLNLVQLGLQCVLLGLVLGCHVLEQLNDNLLAIRLDGLLDDLLVFGWEGFQGLVVAGMGMALSYHLVNGEVTAVPSSASKVTTSADTRKRRRRVTSEAEAKARAKADQAKANRERTTGNWSLMGRPNLVSGNVVSLLDAGKLGGDFLITAARHRFTRDGGYESEIEACRVAAPAISLSQASTTPDLALSTYGIQDQGTVA